MGRLPLVRGEGETGRTLMAESRDGVSPEVHLYFLSATVLCGHFSKATEAKGSGVDNHAGEPFPKAAVS